ncbi:hypothetical protein CTI14_35695 [Methylobacterium radiotolerans]|nr:hypothetical protein CTI14_35695 [Methylobacterium radiotolerans]
MSHLIDGLLDSPRTGRHDLKPQALNLNTLVQEVIADLERDPDAPPTRWNVEPLPTVQATWSACGRWSRTCSRTP